MKLIALLGLVLLSFSSFAGLDVKEFIEKAAKDKKMQEQAKDIAKKGLEYIQGNKEEVKKEEKVEKVEKTEQKKK